MRRLLTVFVVMAAMVAVMAVPAFATPGHDIVNPQGKGNPYAFGYSDKTNTYVDTYKGPSSPPGSSAAGGNPGYTGGNEGTCHGPGC